MDTKRATKARSLSTEPLSPTQVIGERIAALRRYKGMTQQDLADAMQAAGIDIERIVIAKLESGRRSFVKVDELLAFCLVLEISPTDLLVPRDVDDDRPYLVAPKAQARAVDTRSWIAGTELLFYRPYPDEPPTFRAGGVSFASPTGRISDPTLWMSPDRAERIARRYEHEAWLSEHEGEDL